MDVIETHTTIEQLLEQWRPELGTDYLAYRNHLYRVFNFARRLAGAEGEDQEKLALAAAFHDIGIWLDGTFDYLEPSEKRAAAYLLQSGREAWSESIRQIIDQHHRIRPWHGPEQNLVESFRKADWLDVCLFALPSRLERPYLAEVLRLFPRLGFHRRLVALTIGWTLKHPFRPIPVLKW